MEGEETRIIIDKLKPLPIWKVLYKLLSLAGRNVVSGSPMQVCLRWAPDESPIEAAQGKVSLGTFISLSEASANGVRQGMSLWCSRRSDLFWHHCGWWKQGYQYGKSCWKAVDHTSLDTAKEISLKFLGDITKQQSLWGSPESDLV